jgi:glycosyltransferase involved in cell wall biosynthesis
MSIAGKRVPRRLLGLDRSLALHDARVARALRAGRADTDVVHAWPLAAEKTLSTARSLGIASLRESPNCHTAHVYRVVAAEHRALGLTVAADSPFRFNATHLAAENREFRLATGILVPSENVARTFLAAGIDDAKLLRHRYGFDPAEFAPATRSQRAGGLRAAFVGRCEPRKGLHLALRAWLASTAAHDGELCIYGDFAPEYRELLGDLLAHPSVKVVGFASGISEAYRRADVLLLPSLEEGSALVVYEAMSTGCVPLVSDASGAHLDHGKAGLVHPAGDTATLTTQLDTLAANPALLRQLAAAAIAASADLTWSRAVDQVVLAYRSAIRTCRADDGTGSRNIVASQHSTTGPVIRRDRRTSVSVVICTRNRPEMLSHALKSLRANTERWVEILVVDSASTDVRTREVTAAAGAHYVRADRPGLSIARNVGLHAVSGDLVVFTDDDCEAGPGWLEPVLAPFGDPLVGVVSGPMVDAGDEPTPAGEGWRRYLTRTAQGLDGGHGALMAFDRRGVLDISGFDEVLGAGRTFAGAEDLDMFCRMLRAGWTLVHESAATVTHLNHRLGADYLQLKYGYGLGLGAMIAKLGRLDPAVGVPLGLRAGYRLANRAIRQYRQVGWAPSAGDRAMVKGLLVGTVAAIRLPIAGERFVDVEPPPVVDLADGRPAAARIAS